MQKYLIPVYTIEEKVKYIEYTVYGKDEQKPIKKNFLSTLKEIMNR